MNGDDLRRKLSAPASMHPAADGPGHSFHEHGAGAATLQRPASGLTEADGAQIDDGSDGRPRPQVSIIIPTRNERDNVGELLSRLDDAFGRLPIELIFVDDSSDETPDRIRESALSSAREIRLIHRHPGDRAGGLGGAVLAGLRVARGTWALIMDADLQHPPEVAPCLVAEGQRARADLVVGSRYCPDGHLGLGGSRKAVSSGATAVARALFSARLRHVTDPMSGFFAVRLAAFDYEQMHPMGFKILLEMAVRTAGLKIVEVPFRFGPRLTGTSKASVREGVRLVMLMLRLRLSLALHRGRPPINNRGFRRVIGFAAVGVSGIAVNTAALWALSSGLLAVHYLLATIIATQASTTWNFCLTDALVFSGDKPRTFLARFWRFAAVNNAALLLRLPLMALFVSTLRINVLIANVITLVLLFIVRFAISDRLIYAGDPMSAPTVDDQEPQTATRHAPPVDVTIDLGSRPVVDRKPRWLEHRYDIAGVLTVGSQIPLLELEHFRAPGLASGYDVEIRIGEVGRGTPRRRCHVTQQADPPLVTYEEHLGRVGANFSIEFGKVIHVTAGPLLARSPHVLYTNVVEALLRFVTVSRGMMLLHSACLDLGGTGVMLSARTDTGKTGTILRLLRERDARFLSDDMTLMGPDGIGWAFPKPLTISEHTLRAVNADELTPKEWRRLRLQSRIHSKEGRGFGMWLSSRNIPIMAVNAMTQRVVPPPKFTADRLVPCSMTASMPIEHLFIIERGEPRCEDLFIDDALDELIDNTDDAYGFPPFHQFAPAITIDGLDYPALRAREREILRSALATVRIRRLGSDNFGWADEIPELVTQSRTLAPVVSLVPDLQTADCVTDAVS